MERGSQSGGPSAVPGPTGDFAALREQEAVLILLNLGIISSLVLIHVLFLPALGQPSLLVFGLFVGRFVWQSIELAWLHALPGDLSPRSTAIYAAATVWIHVAFGACVPLLSPIGDSHFVVLMVLPTIAAAFRFGWTGTILVALVASLSTFSEVHFHAARLTGIERRNEYFEAATVVLIFFAVAIVVRLLVGQLRIKEAYLRASLDELARARDRLVAEEKLVAIGRLSAAVAHEVRNPIAIIGGAVANWRHAHPDQAARDQMVDVIEQQSERLARLTEAFLDYARQKSPERVSTSLHLTLDYVASLARPHAEATGTTLEVACLVDVEAAFDAFQLHQALLNLTLNAIDAAGPGGRISLGGRLDGSGGCVFTVCNTGAPIPAAVLPHIFEPFYTTRPKGTGLGLAIARKIAEAHGGALALASNQTDNVVFELRLPCVAHVRRGD